MVNLQFLLAPFRDPFGWRYCYHSGTSAQSKQTQQNEATSLANNQQLTNTAQGTLGQFEGPVQDSPFYKALLTQGTEATSNAYGNADANMRQKANLSGFGYNQPIAQGGEAQVASQEAGALSQLPQQAMLQASQPALQAAGQTGQLAGQQGNMAVGFGGQATQEDMQAQQYKNNLYSKLLNTGINAAGAAGSAAGMDFGF